MMALNQGDYKASPALAKLKQKPATPCKSVIKPNRNCIESTLHPLYWLYCLNPTNLPPSSRYCMEPWQEK